ncbi:hypothetical protein ACFX2C_013128 [Malus domestica]
MKPSVSSVKVDIEKFDGNDFGIWQLKMHALLVQQGLLKTLKGVKALPDSWTDEEKEDVMEQALGAILLTLLNEVLREVGSIKSAPELWIKLESLYMTKSLAKRLYLKKSLHTLRMDKGTSIHKHVDEFNKLMMDLKSVDNQISDEDYAITLLCSLSPSYEHFVDTMLFGRESLSLEDVKVPLNSKELKNKMSDTQDGVLVVQGRNKERSKLGKNTCSYCYKDGHWKVDCPKLKGKKKLFDKSFASVDANIAEDRCSELL